MKKLIFSLALFMGLLSHSLQAQVEYMHSIGANYHILSYQDATSSYIGGIPMIEYNPRLNLLKLGEVGTFSIGSHIGAGFSFSSNSISGASGYFGYNLPILAQVNLGKGSNKDNESGFGFYVEGGYTLIAINSSPAHGPTAGLGCRFSIRRPLELGLFYTKPINVDNTNVFGLRLGYIFGLN